MRGQNSIAEYNIAMKFCSRVDSRYPPGARLFPLISTFWPAIPRIRRNGIRRSGRLPLDRLLPDVLTHDGQLHACYNHEPCTHC